ncbi:MAG: 30S ribosomal protein S2 [Patescibacteria group bacterium]
MATNTETTSFIDRLFAAGAHYGFKKSRRHPTVASYLYGTKDGNDIFDLEKTATLLENAKQILTDAGAHGKTVLLVGTKDEVSTLVRDTATSLETPYVTNRWIGGMLTNFSEIKKRIARLEALQHEQASGELERKYTKKERVVIGREIEKLEYNFGGLTSLTKLPDLMLVVDPRHDSIAVEEANAQNIPVVAVMSSDCDTTPVQYPVLGNDTLQSSVRFLLTELANAYEAGRAAYTPREEATKNR